MWLQLCLGARPGVSAVSSRDCQGEALDLSHFESALELILLREGYLSCTSMKHMGKQLEQQRCPVGDAVELFTMRRRFSGWMSWSWLLYLQLAVMYGLLLGPEITFLSVQSCRVVWHSSGFQCRLFSIDRICNTLCPDEVEKSNFRQYGQLGSRGGKSQGKEKKDQRREKAEKRRFK